MAHVRKRRRRRWTFGVSALVVFVAVVASSTILAGGGFAAAKAGPANTSPPTVKGKAIVGQTLQADPGTWSGSTPITYTYEWQRCGADGKGCAAISDATTQSYTLTSADVGHTVRVVVTAKNGEGNASATSAATAAVTAAPQAPTDAVRPSIKGTAVVGQTLSADQGSWSGPGPITYSYQWMRCDKPGNTCGPISGATKSTYMLTSADAGHALRVIVGAKNAAGQTNATSIATAPVAQAGSAGETANGCSKGTLSVANVAPPARLTIDHMQYSPGVLTRSSRQLVARFHVSACGASVQGAKVYATAVPYNQFTVPGEATTDGSGWATITLDRLSGFPAARRQQLLALFVRARKPGENLLAGVSTRRLVSTHVDLGQ
jgi:hypothetical protein